MEVVVCLRDDAGIGDGGAQLIRSDAQEVLVDIGPRAIHAEHVHVLEENGRAMLVRDAAQDPKLRVHVVAGDNRPNIESPEERLRRMEVEKGSEDKPEVRTHA